MRTSLFLSTLFAVSLASGLALAEKTQASAGKEPRVVERLRAHGDTVDKVYRAPAEPAARGGAATGQERPTAAPTTKSKIDKASSRINCADSDPHCAAMHDTVTPVTPGARSGGEGGHPGTAGYNTRAPAFLDKILGSDRTNFNEAGEDEGMSARAANRAWAHAAKGTTGATTPLSEQKQVDRKSQQFQSTRTSCNEADDCEANSKDVKKEWAYSAVKAGTWTGPEKRQPTNAARRIAADRAAESASLHDEKVAHEQANEGHGHGAAASSHAAADHPH